ncbi:MAG: LysM peptidoglycan-binding domain-containing protein [Gammaproteobacteria bacterium]|nr:LysM peptidoglycan-binding domain-containing protein [Gammaproteobacteria bacterium]
MSYRAVVLMLLLFSGGVNSQEVNFPKATSLQPAVQFWTRVYTELETTAGFIHDSRHMDVVYDKVHFKKGLSRRQQSKVVKSRKRHYQRLLRNIASKRGRYLSTEEAKVFALWPKGTTFSTLRKAVKNIRFQRGQADNFRQAIIRSGRWESFMKATLKKQGVPEGLWILPFVESSFNPKAYSSVGAAGVWQFTRSTGRRYMRIDHVVDERRDPVRATESAALLLKHNFELTGRWPLAITAYNHGASGIRRAAKKVGSNDIAVIIKKHKKGRGSFGFASRNFYTEFLAARHVFKHRVRYFGELQRSRPQVEGSRVTVPSYIDAQTLASQLGVDFKALKGMNLALRPVVWRGDKRIPKGYRLQLPEPEKAKSYRAMMASVDTNLFSAEQIRDSYYKVRRGDALSTIARRYRIKVRDLMEANGLSSRNFIRIGQRLTLPLSRPQRATTMRVAMHSTPRSVAETHEGRYRVRRGDTVSKIARRFALQDAQLLAMNSLRNRNRIVVGQWLQVKAVEKDVAEPALPVLVQVAANVPAVANVEEQERVAESLQLQREVMNEAVEEEAVRSVASEDPSDYTVLADNRVEVQATETLGHYAKWLGVSQKRLRRLNRMSAKKSLVVGKKVKLLFKRISKTRFEKRRLAYHRALQDDYFQKFRISSTEQHAIRRGDSLWRLAKRTYKLPLWLLRQYNPDVNFNAVHPGMTITIPKIERRLQGALDDKVEPLQEAKR